MNIRDLIPNLAEFYRQCSIRGWCFVKIERGGFLTLKSSETNFTHCPFIFSKFPKLSIVSPKLSAKNYKILTSLISEFDSQRIISIIPSKYLLKFSIIYEDGTVIKTVKLRKYSFGTSLGFIISKFFKTV